MTVKRKFIPGDEWIYLKIYSGPKFLDDLLINEVYETAESLYAARQIDKFFFLRFTDEGGYHLRLRFHVTDQEFIGTIIILVNSRLDGYVASRIVSRIILDTYNRELERYGHHAIEYIETIFSINSSMILDGLRKLNGEMKSEDRWQLALVLSDNLLDKFGFSLEAKYEISEHCYKFYQEEFKVSKQGKDKIQTKFRESRKKVEECYANPEGFLIYKDTIDSIFTSSVAHIKEIISAHQDPKLDKLMMSLLHMTYNRVFRTKHRLNELVLHSLASNYYRSALGRKKKETVSKGEIVSSQ